MLSQEQFGQLSLPGMPARVTRPAPAPAPEPLPRAGYTKALQMGPARDWWEDEEGNEEMRRPGWVDNLLPRTSEHHPDADEIVVEDMGSKPQQEWVPTWMVTSGQRYVNPVAVDHQVEHANPLALDKDPSLVSYHDRRGEKRYDVKDGNHRLNAALRRGQLIAPANVERGWEDDTDEVDRFVKVTR